MMAASTPPVLVIVNWRDLEHPQAGGAEVVCQELAKRLAVRGWHVIVLASAVRGRPRVEARDGYWIRRAGGKFTVYTHALAWLLRNRRRISAVIDSQNGIPFFSPVVLARQTTVLMLLHHVHQDQFAQYFPAPVATLGRFLEGTASRAIYGGRGILAVSPSTREDARKRLRLTGEIWVAPPGCSVTSQPQPERTQHPSVVCVGRLVRHKRPQLIVEAFAKVLRVHPDATLVMVGRGTERQALIGQAKALGIDHAVKFLDSLGDAERDELLSTAWMSVNPSAGEGWGLSVIEANALGVPVLAYRRPGLRDSINDGYSGWLVDDKADLADAISDRLEELRDADIAAQYRHQARTWANGFTWDAMADRVEAAVSSERSRLVRRDEDRRTRSDTSIVVTIPAGQLAIGWASRVRDAEVLPSDSRNVSILCRGADTASATRLLERLGVQNDETVRVRVASTRDLLQAQRSENQFHV